ncbi:YdeI/OmpD-associated family protein [Paenibacillus hamazuiensis]|uniref:YdeI/OmpD-associated family protein n=1 Tax=Paenibacillus hamazuiensis TaxID=2936508 RepID=UPI00200C8208|nr:YdeI/OmpD-associated family protein [Paenibacillus hamazuiensis]
MNQDLIKKLRIREGQGHLVVDAPEGYRQQLGALGDEAEFLAFPGDAPAIRAAERRYGFVQWFVTQSRQVREHIADMKSCAKEDALLWICYPKQSSKASSDLNRDILWQIVSDYGLEGISLVSVDNTWSAMRFRPADQAGSKRRDERGSSAAAKPKEAKDRVIEVPEEISQRLKAHPAAAETFGKLSYSHKKEYVQWITGAKKEETRLRRLEKMIDMLEKGLKSPSAKGE